MPEVRLLGSLRRHVGAARFRVEAATVRDALAAAAAPGTPLVAGDDLHEDLRVLVNGRSILFLEGLDTPLGDDDTVTIHLAGARGYPGG